MFVGCSVDCGMYRYVVYCDGMFVGCSVDCGMFRDAVECLMVDF